MDWTTEILRNYGLAGVVIFVLGAAVVVLFRLVKEIYEKRIAESREAIAAIKANTAALETQTATLDGIAETLRDLLIQPPRMHPRRKGS